MCCPLPNGRLLKWPYKWGVFSILTVLTMPWDPILRGEAPRSCLATWHLQLCLWCFRWKHHALLVEKHHVPDVVKRWKNAIQIDNATKNKANFCWQECSISTMLLVEGIWLANFWLVSVSSTVVCLLVAEKWEKKQQKEGFGYWGRAIGSCLALNIGLFEEIVPFWTCVEEILSKTPQIQRIRIEL